MELNQAVKQCTRVSLEGNEYIVWDEVMGLVDPNEFTVFTKTAVRSKWRRINGHRNSGKPMVTHEVKPEQKNKAEILRSKLKQPHSLSELVTLTGLSDIEVLGYIGLLKNEGIEILDFRIEDGQIGYVLNDKITPKYAEYEHYHDVSQTIRIGIVSDTHICSKFWQPTYLKMAYDHMRSMGITEVYHCGDITDGFYKERMEESYAFGADAQVDEVVKCYPRVEGMKTYFITGNHDYTHIRNGGADVGRSIAQQRDDMVHLGRDYAKIWLTDKVDMDIVHPGDGTSYALSYQLQKRINNMSGGKKPKIMISGHYHKNFHMFYRNIHAMTAASFQAQSNWMRGKAIESDIGFVVLDISINANGDIIEFAHKYFPYYVSIVDDYKN